MNKKKDNIQRNVYVTSDYDKFSFFEINRTANIRKQLVEAMEEHGRFFAPIIVDEDFNVYDGQHRLLVAQHLGKPIEYIIDTTITAKDIAGLNTSSQNWSIQDFIESYAKQGKVHYQELEKLESHSITNNINISVVRAIALNKAQSGVNTRIIKEGQFEFYNYQKTIETLELLNSFSAASRGNSIKEKLGNAIARLIKVDKLDKERLIRIASSPNNLYFTEFAYGSINDALKDLIEEYNKGLKKDESRINYAIVNGESFQITDEQTEWERTGLKGVK